MVLASTALLAAGANPPAAVAQHLGGTVPAVRPDAIRQEEAKPSDAAAGGDKVARGRYIVEDVAMCWRCHTPVGRDGYRDETHHLLGGPTGLQSSVAIDDWAIIAPRLAGAPPGTDAEFVRLLTTGISRNGHYLRQPMPQFRMSQTDAESVLAYLKSLGARQVQGTR
jgi:mono/diheme cytochrome c family protein